jgi:alanine dehydrogenase
MTPGGLWITEAHVARGVTLCESIEAVRAVLRALDAGEAVPMRKAVLPIAGGGSLHCVGGDLTSRGVTGVKSWCYTPGGAQPLVTLFGRTGQVLAVVEAFALGQLRTAATSALATERLARPDAQVLAMVGTGRQALAQVAAVCHVRPIRLVRVFSRDPAHRDALAERVEARLEVRCEPAPSVESATGDADVITLATRASEPFLRPEMVARGAHVNAIGAVTPERREFAPELLERCTVVTADSVEQARDLSWELQQHYGDGDRDDDAWSTVVPLSTLVGRDEVRPADADVTLLKALGLGLSDLALGLLAYERTASSPGSALPLPGYAHVDLDFRPVAQKEQA